MTLSFDAVISAHGRPRLRPMILRVAPYRVQRPCRMGTRWRRPELRVSGRDGQSAAGRARSAKGCQACLPREPTTHVRRVSVNFLSFGAGQVVLHGACSDDVNSSSRRPGCTSYSVRDAFAQGCSWACAPSKPTPCREAARRESRSEICRSRRERQA